jgi:hypothetical protein
MVRIKMGRPPSSRNCLGSSDPKRVPLPPATMIAIVLITNVNFAATKIVQNLGNLKRNFKPDGLKFLFRFQIGKISKVKKIVSGLCRKFIVIFLTMGTK